MRHSIKVFLLAGALLFAGAPSILALEPKAGLRGPTSVTAGDKIWLQFVGCQGDSGPFLKANGPESLKPTILYTKDDTSGEFSAASAVVTCTMPGQVTFSVVMIGRPAAPAPGPPVPSGGPAPTPPQDVAVATLTVTVNTPGPPEPPPGPGPGPAPPPAPAPTPAVIVPQATQLFAIGVYSGDSGNANELAFAAVRDDPGLKATLQALNVDWHAWDAQNPKIDAASLRPYVSALGSTPALLIYDATGKIYNAAGAPTKSAIAAPLKSADVVSLFKKLRGVN